MKICPECGFEVDEIQQVCPECGFPFDEKYLNERISRVEEETIRLEIEAQKKEQEIIERERELEEKKIANERRIQEAKKRLEETQRRAEEVQKRKEELDRLIYEASEYERKVEEISERTECESIVDDDEVRLAQERLEEAKSKFEETSEKNIKSSAVEDKISIEIEDDRVSPSVRSAKKIICWTVIILVAIAGIAVIVIHNSNPISKYEKLVKQGKTEEALELYSRKIANDEVLGEELIETQNAKMDNVYLEYYENTISYDEAIEQIDVYASYDSSKKYAQEVNNKLSALKASRESYEEAKHYEAEGELEKAIKKYKAVIGDDENYSVATAKVEDLGSQWKQALLDDASKLAANKEYKEAILLIKRIINTFGEDNELTALVEEYETAQAEQYVKVVVTDKTVIPRNQDDWIFYNYVIFEFSVTNNSDKAIQGVEGTLNAYDLFGKEIISMNCDFTGNIIQPGDTCIVPEYYLECNEFDNEEMKLFKTDYRDLNFSYEIASIVYSDGTRVIPE